MISGDAKWTDGENLFLMTDFGRGPPNLANVTIAQNKVYITLNFTKKEA
jgi:hypothetical protein